MRLFWRPHLTLGRDWRTINGKYKALTLENESQFSEKIWRVTVDLCRWAQSVTFFYREQL